MWKRSFLFVLVIVISSALSITAYASYLGTIQATKVQYPIIVDNAQVDKDIPMVSIEDRIYLPIRAICDVLEIGIEWNEEGRVAIMTDKADVKNDSVEIGYYGLEGWTATETLDLEITKETAVVIANDVFSQIKDEDFVSKTTVGIRETDDKRCYAVFRYEEDVEGGELSVIVRKSDGKVLRIVAGE